MSKISIIIFEMIACLKMNGDYIWRICRHKEYCILIILFLQPTNKTLTPVS